MSNKNKKVGIGLMVVATCIVLAGPMPPKSAYALKVDNESDTQISVYLSARGAQCTEDGNEYYRRIRQSFANILIDGTGESLTGRMSARRQTVYDEYWRRKPEIYTEAISGVEVDSIPSHIHVSRWSDGSISAISLYDLIPTSGIIQYMWSESEYGRGIWKVTDMTISLFMDTQGELIRVAILASYEFEGHRRVRQIDIYASELDTVDFNLSESQM